MTRRVRRNHSPAVTAKLALATIKGEKTLADLAQKCDVHPNQTTQWRSQLLEGAAGVFGSEAKSEATRARDRREDAASDDRGVGAGERFFVRRARL